MCAVKAVLVERQQQEEEEQQRIQVEDSDSEQGGEELQHLLAKPNKECYYGL